MLDVFDIKLGPDAKMPRLDADNLGLVAVQMLDAVQTVVDVLTDNDGGKGWKVTFDPSLNAYTDRSAARHIVISGKPLLDAQPGTPLVQVARIMTGFAVHEVGHTKLNFYNAVKQRWPGKQLPLTLTNIIEDVVLEERTCQRYNGFADHGQGNVFRPTLEWVAELTSPKYPLKWDGSTGHKVNVTGQMVRYRDFVTFETDDRTQKALAFITGWTARITHDLTPQGAVTLIEDWLNFVQADLPDEVEPPKPPKGNDGTDDQTIPDEDDDDTEGGSKTDAPPTDKGEGKGEAEDGEDGDSDESDEDDGTEGEGDSDDDESDEGNGTEGDDGDEDGDGDSEESDGDGEDGEGREGDGNDADTTNRTEGGKGSNDGLGAGGSGQAVAEAGDEDPDAGFDPAELDKSFDDLAKPESTYQQNHLSNAEQEERVTTRLDAGAHGKMRVIFR